MRVLALDLSTKTGWACGSTAPTPISHGVVRMPKTGEDIGRYLQHFRDWLGHAIEELAPGEIVYESPIMPSTTSLATLRKLYSLAGVVELVALDYKLPYFEAYQQSIRKHFIGTSKAPKEIQTPELRRLWLKQQAVTKCRSLGFRVASDDDAEAIGLLSYRLGQHEKDFVLRQMPVARAA